MMMTLMIQIPELRQRVPALRTTTNVGKKPRLARVQRGLYLLNYPDR